MNKKSNQYLKKKLVDLPKAWNTASQDHFKRLQESRPPWKQNIGNEEWLKQLCMLF